MAKNKTLKVASIETTADYPEVCVKEGTIQRQLSLYIDEMIREAIRTEIGQYSSQGDDSANLKKLIQEEVRKYLTKEHVQNMVKEAVRLKGA